jgi:aminoglycoside phosphotransferase (APT) family kinase protein
MTLRCTRDGAVSILKGFRKSAYEHTQRAHVEACRAALGGSFRIPALHGHDARSATLAMEHLAGPPLELGSANSERFFQIGVALRAFQSAADASGFAEHGPDEELGVVDRSAQRASDLGAGPSDDWLRSRAQLTSARRRIAPVELVACHRDLHDGQLFDCGRAIGLIDFDLLCRADPLLDAANLAAHLQLRALQHHGNSTPEGALAAGRALLEGLDREAEASYARRLRFYQATTFLRLALVYAVRPRWASIAPTLMLLCQRCIEDCEDA